MIPNCRMEVGLERIKRICGYAEQHGAQLLLENTNWEPDRAEVHYLAHSLEETNWYFDQLPSANLGWSFTINHATLVPEGIAGFLEGGPHARLGEVRMADNNGEYELHMQPGTGIIDWTDMFRRVEATGFTGHYMNAFGSLEGYVARSRIPNFQVSRLTEQTEIMTLVENGLLRVVCK